MFYHVMIEVFESVINGELKKYYEFDIEDLDEIIERIIVHYCDGEMFQFNGYLLRKLEVASIVVRKSEISTETMISNASSDVSSDLMMQNEYSVDITNSVIDKAKGLIKNHKKNNKATCKSNKVFIVHGHDGEAKEKTARFIEKLGFEAIILHEQASGSRTIIEKIENYSDETDFAIVLYTPDDMGNVKSKAEGGKLENRARQNVVFEHGFLIGKLGRENVIPLVDGHVELPNDISGMVYISNANWQGDIAKEMHLAGYEIDFNKLFK